MYNFLLVFYTIKLFTFLFFLLIFYMTVYSIKRLTYFNTAIYNIFWCLSTDMKTVCLPYFYMTAYITLAFFFILYDGLYYTCFFVYFIWRLILHLFFYLFYMTVDITLVFFFILYDGLYYTCFFVYFIWRLICVNALCSLWCLAGISYNDWGVLYSFDVHPSKRLERWSMAWRLVLKVAAWKVEMTIRWWHPFLQRLYGEEYPKRLPFHPWWLHTFHTYNYWFVSAYY